VTCFLINQFHIRTTVREIHSHLLIKRSDTASPQTVIVNFNSELPRIEISMKHRVVSWISAEKV